MIRTKSKTLKTVLALGGMPESVCYAGKKLLTPEEVKLESQHLIWRAGRPKWVEPHPGLVLRFARLHDAPAEEILDFAKNNGMLDLCKHGEPGGHVHPQIGEDWVLSRCSPPAVEGREAVEHWREVSRRLSSLLGLASQFHQGNRGRIEDWRILLGKRCSSDGQWLSSLRAQKATLFGEIERLQVQGNVRFGIVWEHSESEPRSPEVRFGGNGLFGALIAQATLVIVQAHSLLVCRSCGHVDLRKGNAGSEPSKYCSRCGLRAAWRANKAAERQTERRALALAGDLRARGRPIQEIAIRASMARGLSRQDAIEKMKYRRGPKRGLLKPLNKSEAAAYARRLVRKSRSQSELLGGPPRVRK